MKNFIMSSFFVCCISFAFAQKSISGRVVDGVSSETLAYVSIGLPGTSIGTVSGEDGRFILEIPANMALSDK
ncbi:MAG: hypothetical protein JNJ57_12695, partial [Saprospiraceae bacterium]|nr:hypothetical protein [Saprospiraceae bacterium]